MHLKVKAIQLKIFFISFSYILNYILNMGIIIFLVKILGINEIIAPLIAPIFSTPPVFFLMRAAIKK